MKPVSPHRARNTTASWLGAALVSALALVSCSPKHAARVAPSADEPGYLQIPFKRADQWAFSDAARAPTQVEVQLRRHFERVFSHAQFSTEQTCVARERADYMERHWAFPDEATELEMILRCDAFAVDDSRWQLLISDGTLLDAPLAPATLEELNWLPGDVPQFSVFGITARYVGPNALVILTTAKPGASVRVGAPDAVGKVRVEASIVDDRWTRLGAVVNQGELGAEWCEEEPPGLESQSVFSCAMAPGDDHARITFTAAGQNDDSGELGAMLARAPGWVPPREYRRVRLDLPKGRDTASAIVDYVNAARARLERRPLTFAKAESERIRAPYQTFFRASAAGDWSNQALMAPLIEGRAIPGPVWLGELLVGIAFDGDASDWLAYRLANPMWRRVLFDENADLVSVATQGDVHVGFGAAMGVYTLLDREQEEILADGMAKDIALRRGERATRRLPNPPEFEQLAREIAHGKLDPETAFTAAVRRLNSLAGTRGHIEGLLLEWTGTGFAFPDWVLAPDQLDFGILVTHQVDPGAISPTLVGFVWFALEGPALRQALR